MARSLSSLARSARADARAAARPEPVRYGPAVRNVIGGTGMSQRHRSERDIRARRVEIAFQKLKQRDELPSATCTFGTMIAVLIILYYERARRKYAAWMCALPPTTPQITWTFREEGRTKKAETALSSTPNAPSPPPERPPPPTSQEIDHPHVVLRRPPSQSHLGSTRPVPARSSH